LKSFGFVVWAWAAAQGEPDTSAAPSGSPPVLTIERDAENENPERVPLDAVAAVVDRRVITLTEVEAFGRLSLLRQGGPGAATAPLDDAFRRAVLDSLIVTELLALEARRTPGLFVREADVDKAVAELRGHVGDDDTLFRAFLARCTLDDESLRAMLRRDLSVQVLLGRRLADTARVGDDDVRAYLLDHPELRAGASLGDRLAAARAALLAERRERGMQTLIEEVRQGVEVRVVASFGAARAP
jgi:hypothetical protein